MRIWVDADACPKIIKEILFRAAIRTGTQLILVANQPFAVPIHPFIKKIQVLQGVDSADNHIVESMQAQDMVITADIPLAYLVVKRGGMVLSPRGELLSEDNVCQRLAIRNMNQSMRDSGIITKGPSILSQRDSHTFASQLDKILTQVMKQPV